MKRIIRVMAIAAVLALCLAGVGCAGTSGSSDNAITVTADGSAQVSADTASFTLSVTARGDDENQSRANASAVCDTIIGFAKAAGLSDQDITKTDGDNVAVWGEYGQQEVMGGYWTYDGVWIETGPEYYYYDMSNQIVGYDASATLELRGVAVDKVFGLVQQSREAGATGFANLQFSVTDREGTYTQALSAAVDAAHAKAETLAAASGVYVGSVVNMVENSDPDAINLTTPGDAALFDAQDAAAFTAGVPSVSVPASVTVSYAIS